MKSLLILTTAWLLPCSLALRPGLIRIPKEATETALEKVLGAEAAGQEFGRLDKRGDSLKYVLLRTNGSQQTVGPANSSRFLSFTSSAFRELFYESELSMSLSMSIPPVPPPPAKETTSSPAAAPLPSTDDPLDADPDSPLPSSDAPSATPTPFGDLDGESEAANTATSKESAASTAPQVAMLSLLSLAAVAVVAAVVARKVHVNRRAAAAEGKSLSDESVENSMDPSATEQGSMEPEMEPLQSTTDSPPTNNLSV